MRSALFKERAVIEKRLHEIDQALGGNGPSIHSAREAASPTGRMARATNPMSLREAVLKVLTATPISRQELLAAVEKIGYRFASNKPLNSLLTFLYGPGKKLIKRVDGKFAAVSAPSAPAPTHAKKLVKAKRKVSPAARKRMAEAARKRWADKKKTPAKK